MPITVIAVLAAIALATPGPGGASAVSIPADGRVTTPEGVSFQLPAGFTYSIHEEGEQRTYVAGKKKEATAASVNAFVSDAELPCDPAQAPPGVRVTQFKTSRGLRACSIEASSEESALAISIVFVKSGETFVLVNALAPSNDAAHRIAAAVANSVQVSAVRSRAARSRADVLRAEPRMLGCFEDTTDYAMGEGFASRSVKRCFHEDFTFTECNFAMAYMPHVGRYGDVEGTSSGYTGENEKAGLWSFRNGTLLLTFEDGTEAEWEIRFVEEDILASERLWNRL